MLSGLRHSGPFEGPQCSQAESPIVNFILQRDVFVQDLAALWSYSLKASVLHGFLAELALYNTTYYKISTGVHTYIHT